MFNSFMKTPEANAKITQQTLTLAVRSDGSFLITFCVNLQALGHIE